MVPWFLRWQRNMIHPLTQQIIRADLGYWLSYVALRPDGNPRHVSYPYYTKWSNAGDHTFFQNCDMNVKQFLATGRGANITQGMSFRCVRAGGYAKKILGSMSLDDETRSKISSVYSQ